MKFVRRDNITDGENNPEDDSDDDSDEFENALEEFEIDQSSDLYKTIVAAIMEDDQSLECDADDDDAFGEECESKKSKNNDNGLEETKELVVTVKQNESKEKESIVDDLLEEAVSDIHQR